MSVANEPGIADAVAWPEGRAPTLPEIRAHLREFRVQLLTQLIVRWHDYSLRDASNIATVLSRQEDSIDYGADPSKDAP